MFRTKALFSSGTVLVKKSTGITGLAVVPNWKPILLSLYTRMLEDIKMVPQEATFRKSVEQGTKYRMKVVEKEDNLIKVEDEINCGQVEELIVQAKDDLNLIQFYVDEKMWEE